MKIVALSGSLRKASYNSALLRAAVALSQPSLGLVVETIRGIPLYDGDEEAEHGVPPIVAALKDVIAASDGLLLVTPEYNGGIPGVFKNAIDWLSRPASDIPRVFRGKAVGVIGATPGPLGTRLSQTAWLQTFRALQLDPYFGSAIYLDGAGKQFDATSLELTDAKTRERLAAYLKGFEAFAAAVATTRVAPPAAAPGR